MIRAAIMIAVACIAAPAFAQETKEESCALQAQVVAAIQQARLDRVSERDVQAHILAQDPTWPEKFNNTIPLITPWVYEQRRRIILNESLSDAWNELCLQQ